MKIDDQTALVTGANRGIGRAFVTDLLERGARRVYAGARDPGAFDDAVTADPRVVPVRLDVTDPDQVAAVARLAPDVSLLVNNAGVAVPGALLTGPPDVADAMFEVNALGPWRMTHAFAPALIARRGAVVNVLSAIAWFSPPGYGVYGASKAAAWSLTNGLRAELAGDGVLVQALHFGAVDTDFAEGYDGPMIQPHEVTRASLDGLEQDQVEVTVDAESRAAKRALTGPPNAYVAGSAAGMEGP